MHFFPGVPWDAWPTLPYDLVMGCISFVDARTGQAEEV
jgi:hypothetical protein